MINGKQRLRELIMEKISDDVAKVNGNENAEVSADDLSESENIEDSEDSAVYDRFQAEFNLDADTLNEIDGFAELSPDKKSFVLHNLYDTALKRVESESIVKFRETAAESNIVGKWLLGLSKGYQLNKNKQELSEDIFKGEVDQTETLEALTSMISDGPDVLKQKDGSFKINLSSEKDFEGDLNTNELQALEDFNLVADDFNQLPFEYKTGTPEQQELYANKERLYDSSKNALLIMKEKHGASEEEILSYGNDLDRNLIMDQFISSNPEVEDELLNIRNDSALLKTIKHLVSGESLFTPNESIFIYGMGIRAASTSLLTVSSLALAPLLGMGLGGIRGHQKGKENLSENELLARSGVEWVSKEKLDIDSKNKIQKLNGLDEIKQTVEDKKNSEVLNIVDAEKLVDKLDYLVSRLDSESDNEADSVNRTKESLKARIDYTEDKLRNNLINFGTSDVQRTNQLKLLQTLGRAKAYGELPTNEKLDEKLEKFLGKRKDEVIIGQKKFVRRRMFEGAAQGACFGFAGAAIVDLFSNDSVLWDRSSEGKAGTPATSTAVTEQPPEPVAEINQQTERLTDDGVSDKLDKLTSEEAAALDISSETPTDVDGQDTSVTKEADYSEPSLGDPTVDINSEQGQMLHEQTAEFTNEAVDPRIESLISEIKKTPEYIVQPGDNIWNIIESKLEAHDLFKDLEVGQKTHMIDELKDRVSNMSPEELRTFGIQSGDPNIIMAKEELDFSQIIQEGYVEEAVVNVKNLSPAQILQIENYTPANVAVVGETNLTPDPDQALGNEVGLRNSTSGGIATEVIVETQEKIMMQHTEEIIKHDVHGLYGSDGFFGILGTQGVESADWEDLKDRSVTEVMEKGEFSDPDDWDSPNEVGFDSEEAVEKAQNYLQKVSKESGITALPEESVDDFLFRAIKSTVRGI